MSHKSLLNASLYGILLSIDRDLIRQVVDGGCSCGGRLHRSDYVRKPRGPGWPSAPEFSLRFSACCDREGCRRRATSASTRFLGRRVYLGVMVVLVTALRQGPTPLGTRVLRAEFGVDRRTVERWRGWWRDVFLESRWWRLVRAALVGVTADVPISIVGHLCGFEGGALLANVMRTLAGVGQSPHLPDLAF